MAYRGAHAQPQACDWQEQKPAGPRRSLSTVLMVMLLVVGVCIMAYPTVSDMWNSMHQSRVIAFYDQQVEQLDEVQYEQVIESTREFNQYLETLHPRFGVLSEEDLARYDQLLNVIGNGVMGYIRIPSIGVSLPIYHGVSEDVLQIGVGHVESSSLPIGGPATHVVLSGHRGLPSARLFTDLNLLKIGDRFELRVLGDSLVYEVDQILTVLPDELESLGIEPGQDLVTLVTCTPYGINTHRLLVRGHRVDGAVSASTTVVSEASRIDPLTVVPFIAIPLVAVGVVAIVLVRVRRAR